MHVRRSRLTDRLLREKRFSMDSATFGGALPGFGVPVAIFRPLRRSRDVLFYEPCGQRTSIASASRALRRNAYSVSFICSELGGSLPFYQLQRLKHVFTFLPHLYFLRMGALLPRWCYSHREPANAQQCTACPALSGLAREWAHFLYLVD